MVLAGTDLNKCDATAEPVDHLLIIRTAPTLGGEVALDASVDDPETGRPACNFLDLGHPAFFLVRKVKKWPIDGKSQGNTKFVAEIVHVTFQEMSEFLIAAINEGILKFDGSHVVANQLCDARIAFPDRRRGRIHLCEIFLGVLLVEHLNGSCHHEHVTVPNRIVIVVFPELRLYGFRPG